jgi:hypothetical protein
MELQVRIVNVWKLELQNFVLQTSQERQPEWIKSQIIDYFFKFVKMQNLKIKSGFSKSNKFLETFVFFKNL